MNEWKLDGLGVEISSKCNYRCVGCPNPSLLRGWGDMDPSLFLDIFREVGNNIYKTFLWNYGDPLLNPYVAEMLGGIRDHKCRKVLSTTGWKLEDFPELCFLTSLDELIISINGLTQEAYEMHQRGGDFEKVIRGIKRLTPTIKGSRTKLIMQMVAHKGNLHQVDDVERFARELGFHEAVIKSFNVMDMKRNTFDTFVPINTPYSRYRRNPPVIKPYNPKNTYPCTRGMVINWEGSVNPCCWDYKGEHILGNVKEKGVYAVWNSLNAVEHRERVTSGKFLNICVVNCFSGKRVKRWNIGERVQKNGTTCI